MAKKQEPMIMKSPITKEYFYVNRYKELGEGRFEALSKRKATKEEIEEYEEKISQSGRKE